MKRLVSELVVIMLLSASLFTFNVRLIKAESPQGLVLQMRVKQTTVNLGENLEIMLTLKNTGEQNVSLQFSSSKVFDLSFQGYRWSDDKCFAMVVWKLTLEPNETYVLTLYWNLYRYDKLTGTYHPPSPGTYELLGYVTDYMMSGLCVSITVIVTERQIHIPTPISSPGDVNFDGKVDIYDVVMACVAYGSKEGDPNWNPFADHALPWNKIDIYDIVTVTSHYGKTYSYQ